MFRHLLLLALACIPPSQCLAQNLALSGERATIGLHGPARTDAALIAGDHFSLRIDISGLAPDGQGRVSFATQLEVLGPDGKVQFADQQEIGPLANPLGGSVIRHALQISTGLDQAPGNYRLKVTIIDRGSKTSPAPQASLESRFTVKKPELALVRTQFTADPLGKTPVPPVGQVGQTLFLNTVVIGMTPNASNTSHVQIEVGVPGAGKPLFVEFRELPKETEFLPLRFDLPLNQAGVAQVTIKVTDQTSKKSASTTIPIRVVAAD